LPDADQRRASDGVGPGARGVDGYAEGSLRPGGSRARGDRSRAGPFADGGMVHDAVPGGAGASRVGFGGGAAVGEGAAARYPESWSWLRSVAVPAAGWDDGSRAWLGAAC